MGFLAIMLAYTIRTALSFAITKMVSHSGGASDLECALEDDGLGGGGGGGGGGVNIYNNIISNICFSLKFFFCSMKVILIGTKNYKDLYYHPFILGML